MNDGCVDEAGHDEERSEGQTDQAYFPAVIESYNESADHRCRVEGDDCDDSGNYVVDLIGFIGQFG